MFTINKLNIMKKSKYQQYFYFQQYFYLNINNIFRGAALIREEALIRRRRLFQYGHRKVRHLLEGGAYLRSGAY